MEISQQMLIEVGLNIVGYLAAGALSIIIYRNFARPSGPAESTNTEKKIKTAEVAGPEPVVKTVKLTRSPEFINFGTGRAAAPVVTPKAMSANRLPGGAKSSAKRDRADIIRIAKEMMKAGATAEKIKGVLPISDAELSLLSMAKNS